jgi:hypothetical protein
MLTHNAKTIRAGDVEGPRPSQSCEKVWSPAGVSGVVFSYAASPVKRQTVLGVMVLLKVPFKKQETNWSCAVACAEMVLCYYGVEKFEQVPIFNKIKKRAPGSKTEWLVWNNDLLKEVHELGFRSEYLTFDFKYPDNMMNQIRHYIHAGSPIIATQRVALNRDGGHSRLIVGFEDATGDGKEAQVVVHDPGTRGVPIGGEGRRWPTSLFAKCWGPKGIIIPAGGTAIRIWK